MGWGGYIYGWGEFMFLGHSTWYEWHGLNILLGNIAAGARGRPMEPLGWISMGLRHGPWNNQMGAE